MNSTEKTAVLLVAHGSRRAEANDDLARLAEALRARDEYPIVEIGYLELAEPTIPDGARKCIAAGARRVLILPYFLSAGAHVTDDLERFRGELSAEFTQAAFELRPPLGLHPLMVEIVLDRLEGRGAETMPGENDGRTE